MVSGLVCGGYILSFYMEPLHLGNVRTVATITLTTLDIPKRPIVGRVCTFPLVTGEYFCFESLTRVFGYMRW